MSGNPVLIQRIRAEVRASGPIPFSRFMELALYDPRHGYYEGGAARLGRHGDFFTASDVGTAFGECMARQLVEIDRLLGSPDPFDLIEFGPGRGLLARDILDTLPRIDTDLGRRLRCVLVERSGAMRAECASNVPRARVVAPENYGGGHAGCVLAIELFDALPVHRVRRRGERLVELFVDLDREGRLVERELEPLEVTSAMARRCGAAPADGDEAELATDAPALLDRMVDGLRRGFVIIIDYGHAAAELYGARHRRGTLLAYHAHGAGEDYLQRVGEQDLTAHVNFSALEDRGRERGLQLLGRTTQDRFLIANGILGKFEQTDRASIHDPTRVKQRLQAMQLIHPQAMGRRFQVCVLSRDVEPLPALGGLADPFAGDPADR